MPRKIILYYDPPQKRARTGHVALLIITYASTADVALPIPATFFFSLYHNTTARVVKANPLGAFDHVIPPSVEDDKIMRGESWEKQEAIDAENATLPEGEEKKKVQELPVSKLLSNLPTDPETRARLLQKGEYEFAIELPEDQFDAEAIIAELNRIRDVAKWSMFAPFSQLFSHRYETHNCCSAIASALAKGRKNDNPVLLTLPAPVKLALWIGYFAFILSSSFSKPSSDDPKNAIIYAPLLYFASQLMQSIKNAYDYANDFISMEKNPGTASYALLFSIYSACIVINAIGTVITPNACSALFKFPANLFREVRAIPGAITEKIVKSQLAMQS